MPVYQSFCRHGITVSQYEQQTGLPKQFTVQNSDEQPNYWIQKMDCVLVFNLILWFIKHICDGHLDCADGWDESPHHCIGMHIINPMIKTVLYIAANFISLMNTNEISIKK